MSEVVEFPKMNVRPRLTIAQLAGRFGLFYVTDRALQAWPDLVLQIMGQIIVIHATRAEDHTLYTAISEHFEQVSEGQKSPVYEWRYERGVMRPYVIDRRDA